MELPIPKGQIVVARGAKLRSSAANNHFTAPRGVLFELCEEPSTYLVTENTVQPVIAVRNIQSAGWLC